MGRKIANRREQARQIRSSVENDRPQDGTGRAQKTGSGPGLLVGLDSIFGKQGESAAIGNIVPWP